MKLLYFICIFVFSASMAHAAAIEIMIGGKSYSSMEAYRSSKLPKQIVVQQEGLEPEDRAAQAKLNRIGFEHRLGTVVTKFEQNWDDPTPKFTINASELESRLKAVLDERKEPILLISDSNKLRIMALERGR